SAAFSAEGRAREVSADQVALNKGACSPGAAHEDARSVGRPVTGYYISNVGASTADQRIRRAANDDAAGLVANRAGTGSICADVVALDDVCVGTRANNLDPEHDIAGDDVAARGRCA